MASSKQDAGAITLRGRFPVGAVVRLTEADGPHQLRPGGASEAVDTATVDKDGVVSFSKGIEVGGYYFISGNRDGVPIDVRIRGRAKDDPDVVFGSAPHGNERTRFADGSFVDEPPEQHQEQPVPEGATWLGQHQVPEGTLQRSDTPRGAASVISGEELERIQRGHRKQEPTEPVVEAVEDSEDPAGSPARTSVPAKHTPAKAAHAKSTTAKGKE